MIIMKNHEKSIQLTEFEKRNRIQNEEKNG